MELERVWNCYANGGEMCDGLVATMHSILQGMGWHWQAPMLFMREGRPHLGLLNGPESWWLHEIRQGLRRAEWRKAGNRRNDMRGIESTAGIDKLATTKAMNSTKIPTEQRNDFRELLCGCVWTQKGQFDCQRAENLLCVCFVVRNLKTKIICSGGARGRKRFASRRNRQATVIA